MHHRYGGNTETMKMNKSRFLVGALIVLIAADAIILLELSGIRVLPLLYVDRVENMRDAALLLARYSEKVAARYGVENYPAVRDQLAKYLYDVQKATTVEDISDAVFRHIQNIKDTILREAEHMEQRKVLSLINKDIAGRKISSIAVIRIHRDGKGRVAITDEMGVLGIKCKKALNRLLSSLELWRDLEIEVRSSGASVVTEYSLRYRIKTLAKKLKDTLSELDDVKRHYGLLPLTGEGVVVRMYDSAEGNGEEGIIHDSDIRDLVNELWSAGAVGVEVGGERIITSSSIRCIGPTILVNNHPITVNPVVVKAIGNAKVLESALTLIRNHLELFGIKMEVHRKKYVRLSKYSH